MTFFSKCLEKLSDSRPRTWPTNSLNNFQLKLMKSSKFRAKSENHKGPLITSPRRNLHNSAQNKTKPETFSNPVSVDRRATHQSHRLRAPHYIVAALSLTMKAPMAAKLCNPRSFFFSALAFNDLSIRIRIVMRILGNRNRRWPKKPVKFKME